MAVFTQYNFTDYQRIQVPALDIEEVLANRGFPNRYVTQTEQYSLREGKEFLKLSRRGKKLIDTALKKNIFSGDSKAIHAWDITEAAIVKIRNDNPDLDVDDIFNRILNVINSLLENKEFDQTEQPDEKYSREFFLYISKLPNIREE